MLMEAWRLVRGSLGDATPKLILIGRRGHKSGEILGAIRGAAWMDGLVELHSRLPDAEVARLLAGACAALYPSIAEGYGLPVAEALALGVPVLCSDLSELREVGRDVPEYLGPSNTSAWARKIIDYSTGDRLARLAQIERLKQWRPPTWENHFRIVGPVIDGIVPTSSGMQHMDRWSESAA